MIYLGPPDHLLVNQGTAYTSTKFKGSLEAFGVRLKEVPIETPSAIGIVDRYHAPFGLVFEIIRADTDRETATKTVFN